MSLFGTRELLALVVLVLVVAVVGVVVGRWRRPRVQEAPRREARLVGATRAVGVVVGVVAGQAVGRGGSFGTGAMLSPTVFGICVLLAVVVGETLVRPRAVAGVRSASLGVRRVRDYAPATWIPVAGMVVATAALLILTTATADLDPDGGAARALTCVRGDFSSTFTPYPGAYYSLPLALGLTLVLLIAGFAARQVVLRPRGGGEVGGDDVLRRRSLRVVVAAAGVAVGLSYVGVAAAAATAMKNMGAQVDDCAPVWAGPLAVVLGFSILAAMGLVLACVIVLIRPGTPSGPRDTVGGPSSPAPAFGEGVTSGQSGQLRQPGQPAR